MKYFMFVVDDPTAEPYSREEDNIADWVDEMDRRGINVHGDRLRPASSARTVRIRGGETIVSDGPFTEAKEFVAGLWIWEVPDRETALALAHDASRACNRRIEVRATLDD